MTIAWGTLTEPPPQSVSIETNQADRTGGPRLQTWGNPIPRCSMNPAPISNWGMLMESPPRCSDRNQSSGPVGLNEPRGPPLAKIRTRHPLPTPARRRRRHDLPATSDSPTSTAPSVAIILCVFNYPAWVFRLGRSGQGPPRSSSYSTPVSYTHLTLPTN